MEFRTRHALDLLGDDLPLRPPDQDINDFIALREGENAKKRKINPLMSQVQKPQLSKENLFISGRFENSASKAKVESWQANLRPSSPDSDGLGHLHIEDTSPLSFHAGDDGRQWDYSRPSQRSTASGSCEESHAAFETLKDVKEQLAKNLVDDAQGSLSNEYEMDADGNLPIQSPGEDFTITGPTWEEQLQVPTAEQDVDDFNPPGWSGFDVDQDVLVRAVLERDDDVFNDPVIDRPEVDDPTFPIHLASHWDRPDMSTLEIALVMWIENNNISRSSFKGLIEILREFGSGQDFTALPVFKDTLRKRFRSTLPLLSLRSASLRLDRAHLPSGASDYSQIYVLDIESVVKRFLTTSTARNKMYTGPARIVKGPATDPWHSTWWGQSIWSSSGHYFTAPGHPDKPLWPSYVVWYRCEDTECSTNHTAGHYGRITWSGIDCTKHNEDGSLTETDVLEIQRIYAINNLPPEIHRLSSKIRFSQQTFQLQEWLIVEDKRVMIQPLQVVERLDDCHIDYDFDPTDSGPDNWKLGQQHMVMRYVFNQERESFRPVRMSTPLRAENELHTWGQERMHRLFTRANIISVPLLLFSDGFGLYRNMTRSLEGLYLQVQSLHRDIRFRRDFVWPLTLGPFGAKLEDVFQASLHMQRLTDSIEVSIDDDNFFVVAPIVGIIGDTPTQQKLAGCLSYNAKKPCRFCHITNTSRGDLDFNVVDKGRYGPDHTRAREVIRKQTVKKRQQDASTALGVSVNWKLSDVLHALTPGLDPIRRCPIDLAHSEYAGLSARIFHTLFHNVLTPAGGAKISEYFQSIPMPPGWKRLPSLLTHRDSFQIQELARAAIILPVVLRTAPLISNDIKKDVAHSLEVLASQYFEASQVSFGGQGMRSCHWLTVASAAWARHLTMSCGPYDWRKHDELTLAVRRGRKAFLFITNACLLAETKLEVSGNRRALGRNFPGASNVGRASPSPMHHAHHPASRPGLGTASNFPVPSIASQDAFSMSLQSDVATDTVAVDNGSQHAGKLKRIAAMERQAHLPNVHWGLHIPEIAREWGGARQCGGLWGEDRHREYKSDIEATNNKDAATTLMLRESYRQTVSMLLDGGYTDDRSLLTAMHQVKTRCPSLIASINRKVGEDIAAEKLNGAGAAMIDVVGDAEHLNPHGRWKISRKFLDQDPEDWMSIVYLPCLDPEHPFVISLTEAYSRYGVPNMEVQATDSVLEWSQKVSFTTSTYEPVCFTVRDFINIRQASGDICPVKLLGLFVDRRYTGSYLFAVVQFVQRRMNTGNPDNLDFLLRCPVYELKGTKTIIPLVELCKGYHYMVPTQDQGLVKWEFDIDFM